MDLLKFVLSLKYLLLLLLFCRAPVFFRISESAHQSLHDGYVVLGFFHSKTSFTLLASFPTVSYMFLLATFVVARRADIPWWSCCLH